MKKNVLFLPLIPFLFVGCASTNGHKEISTKAVEDFNKITVSKKYQKKNGLI